MNLNTYGLTMNGFKCIAIYHCFSKGHPRLTVECYTNGTEYLVRNFRSGHKAWDDLFTNKDDANGKVKYLFSLYNSHKRVM